MNDQFHCVASDGFSEVSSQAVVIQTVDPTHHPVDIADPAGLGERLALRQWLQENKIQIPAAADIYDLRRLYLVAQIEDYELTTRVNHP